MPNWCYNGLTVTSKTTKKALDLFLKKAKGPGGGPLTFNSLVPMPEELRTIHTGCTKIKGKSYRLWRGEGEQAKGLTKRELDRLRKMYGAVDWYDWACAHWGTKWDIPDSKKEGASFDRRSPTCAFFTFDTAWGPPIIWCEQIAELFPELSFQLKYSEEGCNLKGNQVFEAEIDPGQ